jgi:hypothetical protein
VVGLKSTSRTAITSSPRGAELGYKPSAPPHQLAFALLGILNRWNMMLEEDLMLIYDDPYVISRY